MKTSDWLWIVAVIIFSHAIQNLITKHWAQKTFEPKIHINTLCAHYFKEPKPEIVMVTEYSLLHSQKSTIKRIK